MLNRVIVICICVFIISSFMPLSCVVTTHTDRIDVLKVVLPSNEIVEFYNFGYINYDIRYNGTLHIHKNKKGYHKEYAAGTWVSVEVIKK